MLFQNYLPKDRFYHDLESFQPPDFEPIAPIKQIDRWVLASAMQKAIRRGELIHALNAAYHLCDFDHIKVWKRLKVILLEDVASDCPTASNLILWAGNHHAWRRNTYGDKFLLAFFIHKMAQASKSRLINDLGYIANHHPDYREAAEEYATWKRDQLSSLYLDNKADVIHRTIAAAYLCGTQNRNLVNLKPRKGNYRQFLSIHPPKIFPSELIGMMGTGFSGGDNLSRTVALGWLCRKNAGNDVFLKNEINCTSPDFAGWKSEIFDVHTWIGKKAYRAILKSDNSITEFLRRHLPEENHTMILGMSVFSLEGMLLDQRESFTLAEKIRKLAVESYVSDYHLLGTARDDFFEIVKENLQLVHQMRKRVFSAN